MANSKKPRESAASTPPEWERVWSEMSAEKKQRLLDRAPKGYELEWPTMTIEQKVKYLLLAKQSRSQLVDMEAVLKDVQETQKSLLGLTPPPEDGIGDRIKARREELRLNVEELARLTKQYDFSVSKGISSSTLRRYEYKEGGFKPGAREICLLCDSLDVSADWLVRGIAQNVNSPAQQAFNSFLDAIQKIMDQQNSITRYPDMQRAIYTETPEEREEKLRQSKLTDK